MNGLDTYLHLLAYGAYASIGAFLVALVLLIITLGTKASRPHPPRHPPIRIGELRRFLVGLPDESFITDLHEFIDMNRTRGRW